MLCAMAIPSILPVWLLSSPELYEVSTILTNKKTKTQRAQSQGDSECEG